MMWKTHPNSIEARSAHCAASLLEDDARRELGACVSRVRFGLAAIVVDAASMRGLARVQPTGEVHQTNLPKLDASGRDLHGEQTVDVGFADDEVEEDPYLGVRHGQELNNSMLTMVSDMRLVGRETTHGDEKRDLHGPS